MDNASLLHSLIQSAEPESILVAQDLAMELNCGIPRMMVPILTQDVWVMNHTFVGRYNQLNAHCDLFHRSWAGYENMNVAYVGICNDLSAWAGLLATRITKIGRRF